MKVIVTFPSLADPGGVAGFFRSVLPRLTERGVEVSPLEIGSTRGASGLFHPVRDQIELSSRLRRERADLVHVNPSLDWRSFLRDGLFVRQALRRGLPVLVFFHGWKVPFEAVVETRLRRFFGRTFARADMFLVLAAPVERKLREWGVTAPIHETSTAVPDELVSGFSIARRQELILHGRGPQRILFLSRIERAKGILETLRAVNLLVAQGYDVHLDVAGDGGAAAEARELASSLPVLRARVTFHGYVQGERKKELLEQSHLYCFPSHTEGMPLSLLEALAFGLPVVTRAVGGISGFFEEGTMGHAAESADPAEIASLLAKLLGDRRRMARIAASNHDWAMRRCLASTAADRLVEKYRDVCAAASRRLAA